MTDGFQERLVRLSELRAGYARWHTLRLVALERHDANALDVAVQAQFKILDERKRLIYELRFWRHARPR